MGYLRWSGRGDLNARPLAPKASVRARPETPLEVLDLREKRIARPVIFEGLRVRFSGWLPHSERSWIAIIFGIGFLIRVGLILLTLHRAAYGAGAGAGEAYNIGLSLANNGTYADAYPPQQLLEWGILPYARRDFSRRGFRSLVPI